MIDINIATERDNNRDRATEAETQHITASCREIGRLTQEQHTERTRAQRNKETNVYLRCARWYSYIPEPNPKKKSNVQKERERVRVRDTTAR